MAQRFDNNSLMTILAKIAKTVLPGTITDFFAVAPFNKAFCNKFTKGQVLKRALEQAKRTSEEEVFKPLRPRR